MALIIHYDGRQEEVQPTNGQYFTLDELKLIVGEGAPPGNDYIELYHLPDGRLMILNEEGKLLDLPRNELAMVMCNFPSVEERNRIFAAYKAAGVPIIPAFDMDEPDYIAGSVLVCRETEVR